MEKIIEMAQRPGQGKGEARKLRFSKQIPGICYGRHLEKPVPVSVDKVKIAAILRRSNANDLFTVASEDKSIGGQLVLIKDKQSDPMTEDILHIDFQAINKDEPIKATIAVELLGKAKGVAEGGILQLPNRTLDIKCLPADIPSKIEIDVTELGLNDSMHVSDITLPKGVEVLGSADRTLAVVVATREEEVKVEVAPEAAEPEAAADKDKKE